MTNLELLPIAGMDRMAWMEDEGAVTQFWHAVGPRKPWEWGLPSNRKLLAAIVGSDVAGHVYEISDPVEKIWKPRDILSPFLVGGDVKVRERLAHWIVFHWGGIHSGDESVYSDWLERLGDFSQERVFEFVRQQRADRISSWSKILSFAAYNLYPIYDSRTAVSVNVALAKIRGRTFLAMPTPQNTKLPDAIERLDKVRERRGVWTSLSWTYLPYLFLLRQLVHFGLVGSILEAETRLFANAEELAEEWIQW